MLCSPPETSVGYVHQDSIDCESKTSHTCLGEYSISSETKVITLQRMDF